MAPTTRLQSSSLKRSLLNASVRGDAESIQQRLDEGADVNAKNAKQNTSLISAAIHGHLDCLKILIEAGADVNFCNYKGVSALMAAVMGGHRKCLQELIDSGADVNQATFLGHSPLLSSILFHHTDCMDLLLLAGADVNTASIAGTVPLDVAVTKSYNYVIQKLIEAGADVNVSPSLKNWTFLMESCLKGNVNCAELLINEGADVNASNKYGHTALTAATVAGETKCIKLLLKLGAHVNTRHPGDIHVSITFHMKQNTTLAKEIFWILKAAGERLPPELESEMGLTGSSSLNHLSREAIRKHLMDTDQHGNLFQRIPRLELPSELIGYLLYYVQLD